MILIVFAHPLEAGKALERLEAKEMELGHLWRFEGGAIVVSGMGSVQAAAVTSRYANRFDQIINIGFAGSLKDHPIGTVLEVGSIRKHIPIPESAPSQCRAIADKAYPLLTIGSGVGLLSSDYPIHHPEGLESHDLIDMEGYGIALAAKKAFLPCTMWKVISDGCSENGWETIAANLDKLQEIIADHLVAHLPTAIKHFDN